MQYEVLYEESEDWLLGESDITRAERRRSGRAVALAERYPDSYARKIISMRPQRDVIRGRRPTLRNMADRDRGVVVLDLDRAQRHGAADRTLKVGDNRLVPVTFDDRHGAIAVALRKHFADPEAVEAKIDDPNDIDAWTFRGVAAIAGSSLAPTETHTGTGLYFAKETPNSIVTTIAAIDGQKVTLTAGGMGTSNEFVGGYFDNTTRSQIKAILTHNDDDDANLEGSLSTWVVGDSVTAFDSWSAVQAAMAQGRTDQGGGTLTLNQLTRVFPGTYDEALIATTLAPDNESGFAAILEGDPDSARADIKIAPTSGTRALLVGRNGSFNNNAIYVRHMTFDGTAGITNDTIFAQNPTTPNRKLGSLVIEDCIVKGQTSFDAISSTATTGFTVRDCYIEAAGDGLRAANSLESIAPALFVRCHVKRIGARDRTGISCSTGTTVIGCLVEGFATGIIYALSDNPPDGVCDLRQNTFYDCTHALRVTAALLQPIHFMNNIVDACDYGIRTPCWPDEAGEGELGGPVVLAHNCFNTDIAPFYDSSTTKTLAEYIAFDRVTASGNLDTDPLMTAPGSGDFSLQALSPCRNTGHGSGVVSDVDGTAYDPHHPDIGAKSTGLLTVAAPTITAVDDETGTTLTVTTSVDNAQDVVSLRYYAPRFESAWTLFGSTRTGSGDLQIAGLTTRVYRIVAVSTRGGEVSPPSNEVEVIVTTGGQADVGEGLKARLRDVSGVTDLIATRIYHARAPQNATKPYVVMTKITDRAIQHLGGPETEAEAHYQLDLYAEAGDAVTDLAREVRAALTGFSGAVSAGGQSVVFIDVELVEEEDGLVESPAGAEDGVRRIMQEYLIWHEKAVPSL